MRLRDRVKKLERGGPGITPPMLTIFLTDGELHQPIAAASADDGQWRINREAGETEDAFKARIEASAPRSQNGLSTVMLERIIKPSLT